MLPNEEKIWKMNGPQEARQMLTAKLYLLGSHYQRPLAHTRASVGKNQWRQGFFASMQQAHWTKWGPTNSSFTNAVDGPMDHGSRSPELSSHIFRLQLWLIYRQGLSVPCSLDSEPTCYCLHLEHRRLLGSNRVAFTRTDTRIPQ